MATPSPPAQRQAKQPGVQHEMEPQPSVTRQAYKPADKLKGKIALITGGDSGIGRSVAHHFALEGAAVAFTYVSPREDKDAQETLRLLRDAQRPEHKQPLAIPVDLGHHDNCKEVRPRAPRLLQGGETSGTTTTAVRPRIPRQLQG
ncbi:unnamed protein product, partial [Closterium sp. NIES-53]